MNRRHTRLAPGLVTVLATGLTTAALVSGTSTANGAASSAAAETTSPVSLRSPDRVVAYSYDGEVYTNLGVRLVAESEPFEIWSTRASYHDPIVTEWRRPGGTVTLPSGTMTDFSGLDNFVKITFRNASDGTLVKRSKMNACLNNDAQRIRPDAPSRSPYPRWGCPWNPYTLGSVMGVQAGYSTSLLGYESSLQLTRGKYDVTTTITRAYVRAFGIADEDASTTTRLVVRREGREGPGHLPMPARIAKPAAHEPTRASAGEVAGPTPDLRSLPAWGIDLNRKGTVLRFASTVWNAGDSPLVVDGFRAEGEDHMDAYQYFFDADGNQTGYEQVGEMHWHEANHQHWHFEDFAQYRLLNQDRSHAVKSRKQSFCLANTDAVDYTRPGADWDPENTDLETACGGDDALSVRQVLSAGSGDTYMQYRAGQAFRIANLPNGVYHIATEANPVHNLVESDVTNNNSFRKIRIGGPAHNRWVKVSPVGIVNENLPEWFRGR